MGFSFSPLSSSLPTSLLPIKIRKPCFDVRLGQTSQKPDLVGQPAHGLDGSRKWSFITGSKFAIKPKLPTLHLSNKTHQVHASWLENAQIASTAFTFGTIAVLPFYSLMVLAPNSELTKKSTQSNIPYMMLGLLYAYLLHLSWTPESIHLIFSSKYLMPELTGITKLFSSDMTIASAWIHLLVVDLFAARQVFQDGLENQIETRHSISLCLLSCPIGVLIHLITKAITTRTEHNKITNSSSWENNTSIDVSTSPLDVPPTTVYTEKIEKMSSNMSQATEETKEMKEVKSE